jgi:hypothetical protein
VVSFLNCYKVINMFFEGIFVVIEDHWVGSGFPESCYIWDEYIKLCTESSSDFVCLFTCTLCYDIANCKVINV